MVRKKSRRRKTQHEEDPMAGTANLVDAMLVLAVGFLIFVVISWNMQSVVFSDMTHDQKQEVMNKMKDASEITQGEELEDTPQNINSSGSGYHEMGKVYKDTNTGKLIMVEG
ncbi:MAG: DUF2149 domain-containing protein [Methanosphaera sp.]|nr:DUF2149 domain-containing protein [Methanosphaera sp.]